MATLKQERAVKNIVENRGNISRAMLDAWYEPKTAKNPKNLTDSAWFKELVNKYIPKSLILWRLKGWIERMDDEKVLWHLQLAAKIQWMQIDKTEAEIKHSYKIDL